MMKDEEPNVEYPFELPPRKGQQEINHLVDKGEMLYRVEEVLPEKVQPETQEVLDVLYNMEPWENIVQQRHAKLMVYSNMPNKQGRIYGQCSNCNGVVRLHDDSFGETELPYPKEYKYCQFCGAKIDEVEEA